jgi:hypothetical protein
MGNWSGRTGSVIDAERSSADDLVETLLVQLADELDYWKGKAETLEQTLDETRAEVAQVRRELEKTEAWRKALVGELVELARFQDPRTVSERPPLAAFTFGLALALVLWGLVALIALGGYRLLGS